MFTFAELPSQLLPKVRRTFSDSTIVVTYNVSGQLNLLIDNIKTTFFQYSYPTIELLSEYEGVPLATIMEIAAMKAFSIGK